MFGDNRFNFYGWMIAALMIYAFSLLAIMQAINLGAWKTPEASTVPTPAAW